MRFLRITALLGLARAAWRHRDEISGVARRVFGDADAPASGRDADATARRRSR